jgi:hypothetical protein
LKTEPLILLAPDFAALATLARRPDPAVLWPVGPQSLAAHWLDHAVRLGRKHVVIHALDRPDRVRTELGGGAYWSLQLEISPAPAPAGAIPMHRLPGDSLQSIPQTPSELLHWWFDLNFRWLTGRDPNAVSIDRCRDGRGWIAPGASVHPSALMIAPYWIGADTEIGPDCRVGPYAVIGPNCLLENDVRLEHSLVLRNTFLGRHLDVRSKIVEGGTLLDFLSGTRVELTDKFIASALAPDPKRAPGEEGFMTAWGRTLVRLCRWRPARSAA